VRIGLVDLDTSHPQSWVPIERESGHEVIGVWDGGSVHPAGYAEKFAADLGIPRVYVSLEEMAGDVDCAIIHGCDWDTHVEKARVFVEAGRSVLIDKPLAGTLSDLRQIEEWARQGARVSGGSSVRFCEEIKEWQNRPVEERGTPDTVLCGCAVDEFNYGIHAYSMLFGIMGPGAVSVRHLGKGVQRRVQVKWPDGRMGFVVVGEAEKWIPFYASITTEKSAHIFQADPTKLYRALLEVMLPYLAGETDKPPLSPEALVEPELCALAARQSWLNGDKEVRLEDVADDDGYDGAAFASAYRKQRYPES